MASRSSGKPRCPCERHFCTKLTPRMLEVWKGSEGQKWNWISDTQAYFKFCEECHNRYAWPGDMRCKGPHCKPQPPPWRACAQRGSQGQAHLVSGDFWLTRESPQMPSPEFLRGVASAPGCALPPAAAAAVVAAPSAPSWHARSQGKWADGQTGSRSWADGGVVSWTDGGAWERQAPESRAPGRQKPPVRDPALGWTRSPHARRAAWDEAVEKGLVKKTFVVPLEDRAFTLTGDGFCEAHGRPTAEHTAAEAPRCQRPADGGPVFVQREDAPQRSQGCRGELRSVLFWCFWSWHGGWQMNPAAALLQACCFACLGFPGGLGGWVRLASRTLDKETSLTTAAGAVPDFSARAGCTTANWKAAPTFFTRAEGKSVKQLAPTPVKA